MSRISRAPRAAIVALGLSVLLLLEGLAIGPGQTALGAKDQAQADDCTGGFTRVTSRADMSFHGVTLASKGAIVVGYTRKREPGHSGVRVPASLIRRGQTWSRVPAPGPGDEDGLMAVASRRGSDTWAVGFTTIFGEVKPLAMRWDGSQWTVDRPNVGGSVALFTDVAIVGERNPIAVGYRMAEDGKRKPLVIRKDGPRWRSVPMRIGARESITLTGVALDKGGGTWVVGHGGVGANVKPRIWKRDEGKWTRHKLPRFKGEAVLTDIVATSRKESWAVGYERRKGNATPLVLRWNGKRWKRVKAPAVDSSDVLLKAVSADPAGGVWVVGAAWSDKRKEHVSLAAWWDGRTWNETASRAGGTELHDTVGALSGGRGWAVGRSDGSGRIVRVCAQPQAGVFGGTESVANGTAAEGEPGAAGEELEAFDADDLEGYASEAEAADEKAKSLRKKGKRAKKVTLKIGGLPEATVDTSIAVRDVAKPAGVFEETGTYGAVVEDFDGDGVDDLFIGRHGRVGRLLLNRSNRFVDHEPLHMGTIDRHGCTAADIDGSGLPDLYCAVGGKRGSGLKSNELWLDPGGPAPVEVASARGVADPTGRGRLAALLEARKQKAVDLIVANTPTRVDGLPSLARRFRASAKGNFSVKQQPSIAARKGARALVEADFDRDGREDLLLVTGGPQSPEPGATRLYRNTRKGLVEVTGAMGIRSFDELDAELIDLNKDRKLDLVQIGENKLRISLQQGGKFQKVYERRLTDGRAVAGGDINGDKRGDLYLVRSNGERNVPDVMLVNRGDGRKWSSLIIPQVSAGAGDDAYAIDHDGNGLDDFLVLNGHNLRGPTQLIAFYHRR